MLFKRIRRIDVQNSELGSLHRLTMALIAIGVIFTCLGMGEAVYRLIFFDFDGATDRLPIEMFFGLAFAWMAMRLVKRIYRDRLKTSAAIESIWERNQKISRAVHAIAPVPYPDHQQAIRVIRDEVERVKWELDNLVSG